MKIVKNIKVIIAFILGAIIFSSITTVALSISSKDVSYDGEKSNVQDAINDLYSKVNNSSSNAWKKLAELVDLDASQFINFYELMSDKTAIAKIINSQEAMYYLIYNNELLEQFKNSEYYIQNKELLASSTAITEKVKYEYGLPFYAYSGGSHYFSRCDNCGANWDILNIKNNKYNYVYISSFSSNTSYFAIAIDDTVQKWNSAESYRSGAITKEVSDYENIIIYVWWGAHLATTVNVGQILFY